MSLARHHARYCVFTARSGVIRLTTHERSRACCIFTSKVGAQGGDHPRAKEDMRRRDAT